LNYIGYGKMDEIPTLIRDRRIEEAEAELNQYRPGSASDARWHYHRGLLLEAKGEVQKAVEAFETALEIAPEYTEATFRLAR
jgi:Flp pilus assembly protein TadD